MIIGLIHALFFKFYLFILFKQSFVCEIPHSVIFSVIPLLYSPLSFPTVKTGLHFLGFFCGLCPALGWQHSPCWVGAHLAHCSFNRSCCNHSVYVMFLSVYADHFACHLIFIVSLDNSNSTILSNRHRLCLCLGSVGRRRPEGSSNVRMCIEML